MKKAFFIVLILTAFVSCKKETKTQTEEQNNVISIDGQEKTAKQNDGLTLLKGEFVYYEGAAVLQTHAEIYGVFVNDKMLELNKLAEKYKATPTDMVNIEIRGKVSNTKDDKILWENKVEVVEIINVTQPSKENNNAIKLGNE
ncbi:MAG: hypothetical protein ABJK28_10960 [Algibacter sp.]